MANDTDKLVAAIFAAARCSTSGSNAPKDYLDQYEEFIRLMKEAHKKTALKISEKVLEQSKRR
jgi:fructose-1-phosphate kinase PfkB-like protein